MMNQEIQVSVYTIEGKRKRHFNMTQQENAQTHLLTLHANKPAIYYDYKNIEMVYPHDVTMLAHKEWWFSLMVCRDDDGNLTHVYGNVNTPYELKDNNLSYIDLDIDVLIKPDRKIEVLDEEEFRENIHKGMYSDELVSNTWGAIDQIRKMVEQQEYPFDWKD
jgi:hypothetical protein